MKDRTGGVRWVRGKPYGRVRLGKGRRPSIPLTGCTDEASAKARAKEVAAIADRLVAAGRWFDVEQIARAMGAATTDRALRILRTAAERLIASGPGVGAGDDTFAGFASRWTSGSLARQYPDHVPTKDARGDIGILTKHVNPIVGHIPLPAFTLEHADSVMRLLPSALGGARRRHVAQVLHRVLRLAAFPAKVIPKSPLPEGWLPKLGKGKALQYLYPDEDAALLRAPDVELAYRIFYGFLAREGMRFSEALALSWPDIDLARGAVRLDENKTDDPRAWAMDPSVVATLAWWKQHAPAAGPFKGLSTHHIAERFRRDLKAAGVEREALYLRTEQRRPIRIHDLRATFITVSLANGKTESWVQDRTGHTSTLMIARYRRAARTFAELSLGQLQPLDAAIPEVKDGSHMGQHMKPISGNGHARNGHDSALVAPLGFEPRHPSGPEILKTRQRGRGPSTHGKTAAPDHASKAVGDTDPHSDPHPTHGTWRAVADAYDQVAAALEDDAS